MPIQNPHVNKVIVRNKAYRHDKEYLIVPNDIWELETTQLQNRIIRLE